MIDLSVKEYKSKKGNTILTNSWINILLISINELEEFIDSTPILILCRLKKIVQRNYKKALKTSKIAAENGDKDAQDVLSDIYKLM